ncbi:Trafficking protein particle complex subunit 1 [Temnothorax longispinosus]|uniref:Trafficking protein particle complex subunit n=1 Tax=Temnothorax longispinosus TaxID=300112 RepID=A0A4V3SB61_9HYME|nr:Trafficking protein particle complex subunit 1 [Temnothorax longispinosus]
MCKESHSWAVSSSKRQNNDCKLQGGTTAGSVAAGRVDDTKRKGENVPAMTIHNLYIFSKTGTLLYYAEWNRLNKSGITKEEEAKLMYGMLFSIKSFVSKISPLDPKEGFLYYKTSKYTLHYFETPSGLKFVLNTDNASQNARELLQQLYREVYLEYVVKNPLCQLNEPIQSELFKIKFQEFMLLRQKNINWDNGIHKAMR